MRMRIPALGWLRSVALALPLPVLAGNALPAGRVNAASPRAATTAYATSADTGRPVAGNGRSHDPATQASLVRVAQRIEHRESVTIVAFGSSSTQGVGASSPSHAYPVLLQAELEEALPGLVVRVLNRGIGGQDAADLTQRLPSVLADRPDLVIFQTGTNDPLRGLPLDRFVALTRLDVTRLRAAGVDVMLMEPQFCHVTETTPLAVLYRDALRQLAGDMRVPLIRRWDLMAAWNQDVRFAHMQMLAPDGLHMADAGYELLADEVARQIMRDAGSRPNGPAAAN